MNKFTTMPEPEGGRAAGASCSQTTMHAFTEAEIRPAVREVIAGVAKERFPSVPLDRAATLLSSYKFEWLAPRADDYIARSYEMLGCVGVGKSPTIALHSSLRSHLATFDMLCERNLELPEPRSGAIVYEKPTRTKNISVRMTEDEVEKLREIAELRSVSLSQVIRETVNFVTSSPIEDMQR